MNDQLPSRLERLWIHEERDRGARMGLSLERIVQSGVELADTDGLGAVSMKRVAESLGFTTMSLYRHVANKDELLLHMHDTVWQPPPGLDVPLPEWRKGLRRWTWEQHLIMQRHPWLDEIRLIDRAGTPSQIAWIDLGLRALSGARLTEYLKVAVLLLLSGYVSSHARLASTAVDGTWQGRSESPDRTAQAIGELLRTVDIAERFPALNAALVGGAFAPGNDPTYAPFELGLDVMLDGIDHLVKRLASKPATAPA